MIRKIMSGIWTFLKRKLSARPLGRQLLAEAGECRPSPEKLRALIAAGASLEMRTFWGDTPLLSAMNRRGFLFSDKSKEANIEAMSILLDAGANIRARDISDRDVLHIALDGEQDLLRFFLDRGARVDGKVFSRAMRTEDRQGVIALLQCLSFEGGVEMMRRNGPKYPTDFAWLALHAAQYGEAGMLRQCFAAGLDAGNFFQDHPDLLRDAVHEGHAEIVRVLVENGMFVNGDPGRGTPLHVAARNGHMDIVRYLVERGADVYLGLSGSTETITPMWTAAFNGRFDIVRFLFRAGPDPDRNREELKEAMYGMSPEESAALASEIAADDFRIATAGFSKGISAAMETPAPLRIKKRPAPPRPG